MSSPSRNKPTYRRLWFQLVAGLFIVGFVSNSLNPSQDSTAPVGSLERSNPSQVQEAQPQDAPEDAEGWLSESPMDEGGNEGSESADAAGGEVTEEQQVAPSSASPPATTANLKALLDELQTKEEQVAGYNRDLFNHWIDDDKDGCNTRYEVLIEESIAMPRVSSGCKLSAGSWISAFDLQETTDPSTFDVDHLVPLKEAWDSGAWAWDSATREAFANDLGFEMSLIAVSASSNRSKADRDPAEWMPPNTGYWCEYVTAWVQVKARWSLSVDLAEKKRIGEIAEDCGGETLEFAPRAKTAEASPAPTPASSEAASSSPNAATDPSPNQGEAGGCLPGQVDLNSASVEELKLIKYIDEERAPLVVQLRPFTTVDQLINVKGIGAVLLERIKDQGLACVD